MVHASLRKHGVVFDLRATQGRAVVRDDDKLGLASSERLEGGLVADASLTALHDKGEAGVDTLLILLLLLRHHFAL